MRELSGPHFINVDLEVWSRDDLAAFAAAVEPRSLVLHVGKVRRKCLARIEAKSVRPLTPEQTIWALLKVSSHFPPEPVDCGGTQNHVFSTSDMRVGSS